MLDSLLGGLLSAPALIALVGLIVKVFPTRFTVFSRNTQTAGSLAKNPVKFHWLEVWQ